MASPLGGLGGEAASIERDEQGPDPALRKARSSLLRRASRAVAEQDDARRRAVPSAMASGEGARQHGRVDMAAPAKLSPLSSAVTVTLAGLNSMRSMA